MVVVGLTVVEPPADVDVNVPGAMATLVAPVVAQFNVLVDPEVMLAELALNELITGLLAAPMVTVTVATVDPLELVAVSVYVVVAVGLTVVDPLADAEVKVPGVMATLVAPVVDQLSVVLAPETMVASLAVKEVIAGFAPLTVDGGTRLHPVKPAQVQRKKRSAQKTARKETLRYCLGMLLESQSGEFAEDFCCLR